MYLYCSFFGFISTVVRLTGSHSFCHGCSCCLSTNIYIYTVFHLKIFSCCCPASTFIEGPKDFKCSGNGQRWILFTFLACFARFARSFRSIVGRCFSFPGRARICCFDLLCFALTFLALFCWFSNDIGVNDIVGISFVKIRFV